MDTITKEKLDKYFNITKTALEKAQNSEEKVNLENARVEFINMVESYLKDAKYFEEKNDFVNAFACLNYAHGWLDAGARLGIFDVHDSKLFTQD
ncbi:DUF357 domain-containing protein [archaeon]|nr:DUF357 domain-containing protein [archaeon]